VPEVRTTDDGQVVVKTKSNVLPFPSLQRAPADAPPPLPFVFALIGVASVVAGALLAWLMVRAWL